MPARTEVSAVGIAIGVLIRPSVTSDGPNAATNVTMMVA
jgi:hypothetical protein